MNKKKHRVRLWYQKRKKSHMVFSCYGYPFGIRQMFPASVLAVTVCIIFSMLYQLTLPFTLAMLFFTMLFLPGWIKSRYKSRYEEKRLMDAQIYMEQLLYAFSREEKLLTALQEVMPLFIKGDMHDILKKAVHTILYDLKHEDSLQSGLSIIETAYQNDRLCVIHRFLYKVEMLGGSYEGILALLLKDLNGWRVRMDKYQKECRRARNNVLAAIGIVFLICMITNYILPESISIAGNMVQMLSAVFLMVILMMTYTVMERKLSVNWLMYGCCSGDGQQEKRYEKFLVCHKNREQKTAKLVTVLLVAAGIYAMIQKFLIISLFCIFLSVFLLNQHKIGYFLLRRNLKREIEKAFPQWLMELSLFLQIDNVQVAITKTMQRAPAVLKPALREFQKCIGNNPESIRPYLDFLKEFSLPQIHAAMKMLYAVSAGNSGNATEQLEELIARNQQLMNRSELLMDEDSLAGMYLLFLAPAIAGGVKLICDMTVFLIVFFSQAGV